MQKMHTKSPYGSYHISVMLGVVSTNCHTHYFSAIVSGGISYYGSYLRANKYMYKVVDRASDLHVF